MNFRLLFLRMGAVKAARIHRLDRVGLEPAIDPLPPKGEFCTL